MTAQTFEQRKAEWMAQKAEGTPYTNGDLDKALDSVLYKGQHWKDEINHSCPEKMHDVVNEAIGRICGSHAEFYKNESGRWWVRAAGYWACVGS